MLKAYIWIEQPCDLPKGDLSDPIRVSRHVMVSLRPLIAALTICSVRLATCTTPIESRTLLLIGSRVPDVAHHQTPTSVLVCRTVWPDLGQVPVSSHVQGHEGLGWGVQADECDWRHREPRWALCPPLP